MDDKLDEMLVEAFPNLYRQRHGDMRTTCMCWGFECDAGWFDLIYDLSSKLERLIVEYIDAHPDEEFYPCASQVKEKFGTLRFYMDNETDEMDKAISEAEERSCVTCEVCGKPGKLAGPGWYSTVCSDHLKKGATFMGELDKDK